MWIYLGLISSLLLGFYDVCKKQALRDNAVMPVLFLSILTGIIPMACLWTASRVAPELMQSARCYIPTAPPSVHLHIFAKSLIITVSWTLAYFAMKHLPLSIVSPIRASGPVWTLLGALLLYRERPSLLQWTGMGVVFAAYYAFSLAGRKEGVVFRSNRWVLFIFLATLLGSCSTLYDKYLLWQLGCEPLLVQCWFSFYNGLLVGLLTVLFWWPQRARSTPFVWRHSIALIGLLLIAADFVYFHAVRQPTALIAVLSILRRSSVTVSFIAAALLFKEANPRDKAWALAGILAGILLVLFS